MSLSRSVGWAAVALAALYSVTAPAQQAPLAQQAPPVPQPPQPPPAPQPQQPRQQQGVVWEQMPRMQLEQQYAGPMKDTAIQRWRDPEAGIICYVYTPFTAQHSPPTGTGYVQYGANTIGAISCLGAPAPAATAAPKPSSPPPGKRSSAPPPHTAAQQPPPPPAPAPLPEVQPFGRY